MSHYEDQVAALGGQRRGVVNHALLADHGIPDHVAKNLRDRGVLVSLGRGVDKLRDHPFDLGCQCQAALDLAGPDAVLALGTAARLHGVYSYRNCEDVCVLVRRGHDQRASIGHIAQTRWLPPDHVTTIDGLPVTTLARTFFDLCGHPPGRLRVAHPAHERAMARVYNDAIGRRGLTFTQEAAVLLVMARKGRPGTQLVRKLLLRFGADYVPTRSETETLFMELVWAYGFVEPEKPVTMTDAEGFIGVVDVFWRDVALVVELDSSWHDGPIDTAEDKDRDRRLEAALNTVRRYRYGQLVARPAAIARELRKLGVATRP